jgi:drug/metabolite transporter (DMT)-like permease
MSSKALGIILAISATVAFETSYLLLAAQSRRVDSTPRPGLRFLAALLRRPWWLAAMALNGVAFGLQLLALRHVSLLIVQPLLSLGLIGLAIASRVVLGEQVGLPQLAAAAAIGAGVVLVVIGAPAAAREAHLSFDVASALVVAILALVLVAGAGGRARSPWALVAAAAAGDTLVALAANEVAHAWVGKPIAALIGIAVVAVAGTASVTSESAALQRLPASRVGPIVSSVQVVLPVVIVALLGHEHFSSTPAGGGVLAAGLVLVGAGAYVLGGSGSVAALEARQS